MCFLLLGSHNTSQAQKASNNPSSYLRKRVPIKQEQTCIQAFNDTASGVNAVNTFLLAKMTELMYLERLDYQMRYLANGQQPVDTIPSTDWIEEHCMVTDSNFQTIFEHRFRHYFDHTGYDHSHTEYADNPSAKQTAKEHSSDVHFKYIQRIHTEKAHFLGIPYELGLDPELMVISTPKTIFILFRGTDNVRQSKWAEWLGTDFRINQIHAGGALAGTTLHTGFWLSFDLIRDELIATLTEFEADKKQIWIAGHSLGAALSVVTGVYLQSYGLQVANVYAYACPRTIGNKAFIKRANEVLPNRIQRFEYFQDPVTMVWAPGFKYHHVGKRNWYDEAEKGQYKLYKATQERRFITKGLKGYPNITGEDKKECRRVLRNQFSGTTFIGMNMLHYHNPQWYVKAAYAQLSEEEKARLPKVDDSYPYLYYGLKNTK